MYHSKLTLAFVFAFFATNFFVGAQSSLAQPATKPTHKKTATNLQKFGIPFSISDPDDKYIEVQLYLSKNRGQSWQFYGRESTAANEFPFQATGDGTYWFSLRTLDRDRRLHPEGSMTPELEVVVDTIDPELDFRVQSDASGRLVTRWRASDEHIDQKSVKLSFRPLLQIDDRENVWIPVPYRAVTEPQGGVFADQYAWWPDTAAREVLIQLQISDTAGNTAVEERQIVVPRVSSRTSSNAMVARGTNSPTNSNLLPTSAVQTKKPESSETFDPQAPPKPVGRVWESNQINRSGQQQSQNSAWPSQPDQRLIMENQKEDPNRPLPDVLPKDIPNGMKRISKPTTDPPSNQTVDGIKPDELAEPALEQKNSSPPQVNGNGFVPAQGIGYISPTPNDLNSVVDTLKPASASSRVDSVNTRRFKLNYSLEHMSPELIEKVVLWMTADNGENWTAYGEDADNQSPFAVELTEPGLYGFRVVFHTKDGLAGRAPSHGDDADQWVRLDVDAPQVLLTAAPYGRGEQAGSLVIQWQASDDLFSDRPITLAYSTEFDGPWTDFAKGIENNGLYAWRVGSEVPEKVYLRIQATDAAGNIAFNQSNQPIDLSGLVPKARITGVEPIQ